MHPRHSQQRISKPPTTSHRNNHNNNSEGEQQNRSCGSRSRQKNNVNPINRFQNQSQQGIRGKQKQKQEDSDIDMFADEPQIAVACKQKEGEYKDTNVTDETGYYIPIMGNTLANKYDIIEKLGKGVFGIVVKALDKQENKIYAIKILRKNPMTQASGYREYKILSQIQDKHKLKRVMKVYDMFHHEGHLCIVCELLSTDLRTFTHKKQPTLADIRLYAIGMMLISHQLRVSKIIHADIKPDNFIFKDPQEINKNSLNERTVVDNLKLADFGTSFSVEQYNYNTEYQVARYYRAPQIILGTKIKQSEAYAIDVWAMGCSLFELYTNQFLFNGTSNNDMLKQMMETKGKFSNKMLGKSVFRDKHFDEDFNFLWGCVDKVTKQHKVQKMQVSITAERDLMNSLKKYGQNETPKELQNFRDFLERCLALNPKDRITPQQAIEHPFLHYQTKLQN